MTRLEIDAFLSIVKYGSISSAAEKLYVSQPALSRRIKVLEQELGYRLFSRQRGFRGVELTDEGAAFISVAQKWQHLWQEAGAISMLRHNKVLNLSSINSISTFILSPVFRAFLRDNLEYQISFMNYHSAEACRMIESGQLDFAIIGKPRFLKYGEAIPAYSEPMVFASPWEYPETIRVENLDVRKEIKINWNNEFSDWHDRWFDSTIYPRATLDTMAFWKDFLTGDSWALMPYSVAQKVSCQERLYLRRVVNGPPDRIVYYVRGNERKADIIDRFLHYLNIEVSQIEGIKSYLDY